LEEAEEAAKRALEAASEPLSWTDLGSAQRIMGQVYHGQGRLSEEERQHGSRYELARTYLALGAALAKDAARWSEAKDTLDQAGSIF
jgi:YD repeat-containing protein